MSPEWVAAARPVVHALAGAVPAFVVVLFGGLVALLALVFGEGRRDYALAYTDRCTDLAAVLVGVHAGGGSRKRQKS